MEVKNRRLVVEFIDAPHTWKYKELYCVIDPAVILCCAIKRTGQDFLQYYLIVQIWNITINQEEPEDTFNTCIVWLGLP